MKSALLTAMALAFLMSCNHRKERTLENNSELAAIFENYFNERMKLIPIESTQIGDSAYNDQLYPDFTDSYRGKYREFFTRYLEQIRDFDPNSLNENDRVSYDMFKREMEISLEGLQLGYFGNIVVYPDHQYTPFNQFTGVPLTLGQLGSGESSQPFKTVKDYDNWIRRATAFTAWADSAIVYFRKGIEQDFVLPKALVQKMIPQMEAMVVTDPAQSLFYGPIKKMPSSFSESDRQRITADYIHLINEQLVPSYKKLGAFLKDEYLPKARLTTGVHDLPGRKVNNNGAMPQHDELYQFCCRYWTTTNLTPPMIESIGREEVGRIRGLMEGVKTSVGFKGDLNAFFEYMRTDRQFFPFRTPEEVLATIRGFLPRIQPNLNRMFGHTPKSPFEVKQTEAFRAASASAEYVPGSPDGKRPGIYYVPIVDATKFNVTSGMESTFLHEAIPGHHYQISLQQEDSTLPKFRRFGWYGAYGEGWALYAESLGKELGMYTDPYQYMGALGDEIHRAIRLVVDVGMHYGKMTREEAIRYMMENEAIDEQGATAEIERYMALPGQALSYKIGALKIRELRDRYQKMLGAKFNIADFHDQFLKLGCLPLDVAEKAMDAWASRIK